MVWPVDKLTEQVQALERTVSDDRIARQSELASITQTLERTIFDDRKQRQTEQAAILQALAEQRGDTEASMTTKIQEVQQSLLAEMRRLQLPANFAQMLRDEFANRMGSLENKMQLLLQSFITTQKEVQQLNTLLVGLPNELETLHNQFRSALSRDMTLFKNELTNTLPTHVPYGDDLIEQLGREFAQLRTELSTGLSARAPITEPTLALVSFDGQRAADEQVSERLAPIIDALKALDADYASWLAAREATLHAGIDVIAGQLQAIKASAYRSQIPPTNGSETHSSSITSDISSTSSSGSISVEGDRDAQNQEE